MFLSRRLPDHLRTNYTCDEISGLLSGIMYGGTLSLLPIVLRKLGATNFQVGLFDSLPYAAGLFAFLWAQLSKHQPPISMLVWVRGIGRAVLLLAALSTGPGFMILLAFLYWLFETAGSPAYAGIMKDIYPDEHRARAMGFVRTVTFGAMMVSSLAVGRYLDIAGIMAYKKIYPLLALVGLLALLRFKRIQLSCEQPAAPPRRSVMLHFFDILRRDRRFLVFNVLYSMWGFPYCMMLPILKIFFVDDLQISNTQAGIISAISSLASLVGVLLLAHHVDRWNPATVMAVLVGFVALAAATTGISFLVHHYCDGCVWGLPAIGFVFIGAGLLGLASGSQNFTLLKYLTLIAGPEHVQDYRAVHITLLGVRGLLAPHFGILMMGLVGVGPCLLAIVSLLALSSLAMYIFSRSEGVDDPVQNPAA